MKNKTHFFCSECGYESAKWLGKCPACGSWNSFTEELTRQSASKTNTLRTQRAKAVKISEVTALDEPRFLTGIQEFDRVLGGGLVKGALVLVGGDPGIGKSTLLLQICEYLGNNHTILYVTGEESGHQIKMRAQRLGVQTENLYILAETDLDAIRETIDEIHPSIIIVDSIQTMYKQEITSAPGSVSQVREATLLFMNIAKEFGTSIFVVGHMTKDGNIAGPKVLEHMVDCVLYFEGDSMHSYRILRCVKNRFGSTNEIGVFEMKNDGLKEVQNPSLLFLEGRPDHCPGSAVVCTIEGSRPLLAEVQGLTSMTSFSAPRRMATGLDYNRLVLLLAVLEKRIGMNMAAFDAYVNVVGGIRISETAADLAILAVLYSSVRNLVIDPGMVLIGEVGLTGEIRSVSQCEKRVSECKKLGFQKVMLPKANYRDVKAIDGIELLPVSNLTDMITLLDETSCPTGQTVV